MKIENKKTIYLDETDIKKIIAEHFDISQDKIDLHIRQDSYYGDKYISCSITYSTNEVTAEPKAIDYASDSWSCPSCYTDDQRRCFYGDFG